MLSRRHILGAVLAPLAGFLAVMLLPGPAAHADATSTPGGGGYRIAVTAVVSGSEGDPVPSGPISISVPPVCWWQPTDFDSAFEGWRNVDPGNQAEFDEWYREQVQQVTSSFVPSRLFWPTVEQFKDAMRRHQAGEPVVWYSLGARDGVNCADEGFTPSGGRLPGNWPIGGSNNAPISYIAVTSAPPPPLVEVEDVVDVLWDEAVEGLGAPDLERNPKLVEAGDAALVNLPTWFWVENVEEALSDDGEIHLDVHIPGTAVQASLDASTSGMSVSSPVGSAECTVEQAQQAYAPAVAESEACSFPFTRPNPDGWPVTSSITWTGTWQGTDHNGQHSGELDAQTNATTVDVPVVEAGSVVTEVD